MADCPAIQPSLPGGGTLRGTTPIFPADGPEIQEGVRDTLVLTYRASGFQAP